MPPTPPPIITDRQNPYDFIMADKPVKKFNFGGGMGGGNKTKRLFIALGGLLLLIVLALIFASLLNRGNKGGTDGLLSMAEQQTEIIRISTIGITKAQSGGTKNIAATSASTIQSDLIQTQGLLKKSGVKTSTKSLATGKNPKTDAAFTAAEQSNTFDDVFNATLKASLTKYQTTIKSAYDSSKSASTKLVLKDMYTSVGTILNATAAKQ